MNKKLNLPTHTEIKSEIFKIVEGHFAHDFTHAREDLDAIIADLQHYRDIELPSITTYIEQNEL
jgi:hypothetical protein